ncbi:MAG: hypothetical protein P8Z34_02980 [Anaerolineales bacterium]
MISIIGIDPSKHNALDILYLIYAFIFLCIWGLAVLALLANQVEVLYTVFHFEPRVSSAVLIGSFLILWTLQQLFKVSQSSPIVFSSQDAQLICQTPVKRRAVGLIWLLTEWPIELFVVAIVSIVLSFTLVDMGVGTAWASVPFWPYVVIVARLLPVVFLLHFGALSFIWGIGIIRLSMRNGKRFLLLLSLILVMGFCIQLLVQSDNLFDGNATNAFPLGPVVNLLLKAITGVEWIKQIGFAMIVAMCGLMFFTGVVPLLNMSVAAQETATLQIRKTIERLGNSTYSKLIHIQQLQPARYNRVALSITPMGWLVLVWKSVIQNIRGMQLGQLYSWLAIAIVSSVVFFYPHSNINVWAILFLIALLGEKGAASLRDELAYWWITRLLPFRASYYLLGNVLLTLSVEILIVLFFLCGAVLANGFASQVYAAALPAMIIAVVFCAIWDLLRRSNAESILYHNIPDPGVVFLVVGAGAVFSLFGTVWILSELRASYFIQAVWAFFISVLYAYIAWRLSARALQRTIMSA